MAILIILNERMTTKAPHFPLQYVGDEESYAGHSCKWIFPSGTNLK